MRGPMLRSDQQRPMFFRLLAGILISYGLVIGFGGTDVGDSIRIVLYGFLLWLAIQLRGLGRYRWWALGSTGLLLVAAVLANQFGSTRVASAVVGGGTFVLILALISAIASSVIRIGEIDTAAVLGVLCIYLLLALSFASIHQVLSAFSQLYLNGAPEPPSASDLLYFSVITITTVGFGDITPASEAARAVTVLEALTGQLYLVSVVAGVVGGWRRRRA